MPRPTSYRDIFVPDQTTMPAQPQRQASRSQSGFTIEQAQDAMNDYGLRHWTVNFLLPPPYPRSDTNLACEATRVESDGSVCRQVFIFGGRYLEVQGNYDEVGYINSLRSRGKDLTNYYKAVQEGRRKLVAKVLAAGGEVQLLLPTVVDDDEFRAKLTTPAYRKAQFIKDAKITVKQKMDSLRQKLYNDIPEEQKNIPCPETDRGRRAANAAMRGRDRQARRERNRPVPAPAPPVQAVEEAAVSHGVRQAFTGWALNNAGPAFISRPERAAATVVSRQTQPASPPVDNGVDFAATEVRITRVARDINGDMFQAF